MLSIYIYLSIYPSSNIIKLFVICHLPIIRLLATYHPSIYLSTYLSSLYLPSIYLPICHLSIAHLSIYLSVISLSPIYLSTYLSSLYLPSIYLFNHPSFHPTCPAIYLSYLSVYLSIIYLYLCLSLSLTIHLPIALYLSLI